MVVRVNSLPVRGNGQIVRALAPRPDILQRQTIPLRPDLGFPKQEGGKEPLREAAARIALRRGEDPKSSEAAERIEVVNRYLYVVITGRSSPSEFLVVDWMIRDISGFNGLREAVAMRNGEERSDEAIISNIICRLGDEEYVLQPEIVTTLLAADQSDIDGQAKLLADHVRELYPGDYFTQGLFASDVALELSKLRPSAPMFRKAGNLLLRLRTRDSTN